MPFIFFTQALASGAERLAGTASGPNRLIWRPSGELKGMGPPADPAEKVTLDISFEVLRFDIPNIPFVNVARGKPPVPDQVAEPLGGVGLDFVVVIHAAPRVAMQL